MDLDELKTVLLRELDLRDREHRLIHKNEHEALLTAFDCHTVTHAEVEKARDVVHESLRFRLEQLSEVADETLLRIQVAVRDLELNKASRNETDTHVKAASQRADLQAAVLRQLELSLANLQARLYTVTGFLGVAMTIASLLLAFFR
jgi:hypothetical protein